MNDVPLAAGFGEDGQANHPAGRFDWFDPSSKRFDAVFPHLNGLRRRHSARELQRRAWLELRARVAVMLRGMGFRDANLVDDVTQQFAGRLGDKRLIEQFDPERGEMEDYLYGILRNVAREFLRRWKRFPALEDVSTLCADRGVSDPSVVAEHRDLLRMVQPWVEQLPAAQRQAVSLEYLEPTKRLAHGAAACRHYVNLHRGLKRLRNRAADWRSRQ